MRPELRYPDGRPLPAGCGSLRQGVPGALHLMASGGGYSVGPQENRTVYFGRNQPEVHVCLGADDGQISRRHGEITCRQGRWWLRNTGRRPIRLAESRWLFAKEPAVALSEGYTRLIIPGSPEREYLIEVYVTGPASRHVPPHLHPLSADERLILVVLCQRYLSLDPDPLPLSWQEAADQLARLRPEVNWTGQLVAHRVDQVRERLSRCGVPKLTTAEVQTLLRELLGSTTLLPTDPTRDAS